MSATKAMQEIHDLLTDADETIKNATMELNAAIYAGRPHVELTVMVDALRKAVFVKAGVTCVVLAERQRVLDAIPPCSASDLSAKYHELLFAVERCFPGESRHETALRYIRETERRVSEVGSCKQNADLTGKQKPEKEVDHV